jgi:V/A-type H+/Na+-transporting ATPase subunit I
MLQSMKRIQVVGPKAELNRVVDLLYLAGTVHLENAAERVPASEIGLVPVQVETADDIADVLSKISSIFSTLPAIADDPVRQEGFNKKLDLMSHDRVIARAREIIAELENSTRDLASRKRELALSVTALDRYAKVLAIIQPVEKELPTLEGFEVTILLIQKEHKEVLELIRKELSLITRNQFEMSSTTVDADTLATLMVFNKKHSEEVHSFIYSVNVNEVRLPKEYSGKPFYEMFALIEEQKLAARDEIATISSRLDTLSSVWYQELVVIRKHLENLHDELGAYRNFGLSEYAFVITGWIPKKHLGKTRGSIAEIFGNRVVVTDLPVSEEDAKRTPVFYDNPAWVKPFEIVMSLASLPKYREVDPTPILAVFFPLFFGIMVGDIGYGIIILAIGLWVRQKYHEIPFARNLASMLVISSVPAIIFGYLFGEIFGNLGEIMGWIHPIHLFGITWNRAEAIIPMLILAISIGVVHVFMGLALGVRNAVVMRSRKHLAERSGMLLVISGLIVLLVAFAGVVTGMAVYGGAFLMILGLPLVLYGAGPFGAIEVMSTVGNILSYARLMAIGMASVILAIVANELSGAFGIAIIGIIVAVLLHTLNVALAMFSPSIHTIRLHLVEFFSKFYEGGGVVYKPFARAVVGEGEKEK